MSTAVTMMREPMFRAEQWGIKEECLDDDDGVHCGAMAADSWTLSRYCQSLSMVLKLSPF